MWTEVRGDKKSDFFVNVINGWPQKRGTKGDLIEATRLSLETWKGSNIGTQVLRSQYGKQNQWTRIQALKKKNWNPEE